MSIGFLQWVSYCGFLQKSLNWSWILSSNFLEGGILYGIGGILDHWIYLIICHTHQRSSLDKNWGWIIFLQELWHQLLNSFSLLCFSLTGKKKCIPSHQKGPNYYSGIQKTPPKKGKKPSHLEFLKMESCPKLVWWPRIDQPLVQRGKYEDSPVGEASREITQECWGFMLAAYLLVFRQKGGRRRNKSNVFLNLWLQILPIRFK